MRHECRCPGWPRSGRRPGRQCRLHEIRFLRHLIEIGRTEVSPEDKAGGNLAMQFRDFQEELGYTRLVIGLSGNLCRHFIVWLFLSDLPLVEKNEFIRRRFLAHD